MRNTKLLMAKITMKDWTPTDQNKIKILLTSLRECLPAAVTASRMAITEDGPTPLHHLRTNKTFTTVVSDALSELKMYFKRCPVRTPDGLGHVFLQFVI